ncbi:cytochrome P450 [Acaryochloris sp. IP29b_bin.137]|uniref:cytochrome P450 n=1 Tax=Acaryochloris sp. IP29b_bin.137 TaxID=2969217 RepID=UPI00260C46AB|nr:cytochrome P450 [Acaryochloris sp. IP29b_bin.137]
MSTPALPTTPALFQTMQWIFNPVGYMNTNFKRYGDMFRGYVTWDGMDPLILVNEPKAIQYILTHDTGGKFTSPGDVNKILEPLLGQQNLVMMSGRQHQNRRQLVMPPFHGERLKAFGQIIQTITTDLMAEWATQEIKNIRKLMQKITMRVILEAVFGLYQGERYSQLERLLGERLEMTNSPLTSAVFFLPWLQKDWGPWSIGHRTQKIAAKTDELLFAEIEERRANPDPDRVDILSMLLAAKDEEGNGLSDQDLRDELMTLLVAGHETTATALTWAMYWTHFLPDVKQKLLEELDSNATPTPETFAQLPYLTAVCNETLRIHSVAMLTFPRRVEEPMELCGYQLEPGMLVMGCIYLVHQREDLYPNPQQFRPERFLERQFTPYEFMPFGGGVRRCVGYALAQYEMKIVLGTLLTQCNFELLTNQPVQPSRRGATLGPSKPIRFQKVGLRTQSSKTLQPV